MAQGLDVNEVRVRQRLAMLEELVQTVDFQLTPLNSIIGRQSVSMWTDIPDCAAFGSTYADTLAMVQHGLLSVRTMIEGLFEALKASAADLAGTDQEISDRMGALAERLANTPLVTELPETTDSSAPTAASAPASDNAGTGGTW